MRHALPGTSRWRLIPLIAALVGILVGGAGAVAATNAAAATGVAERPATRPVPRNAMDAVAAMQPGWGPSNTLDAIPNETAWGNPPISEALLDSVRTRGFNSIRIPVTWSNQQQASAPYTIAPELLDRVEEVVDWALADGFYVIIDIHHDSWQWVKDLAVDHDNVRARFDATWQQIAERFRDKSDKLVLENVNEAFFDGATDAEQLQLMDELNRSFHSIVRGSGGKNANRLLLMPTLGDAGTPERMDSLLATMQSLDDSRLIASVHFYGFWPFSVNIAGFTRFNEEVQRDIDAVFTGMNDTFVDRGIPVIIGEIGLLGLDYTKPGVVERGEMLKYFEAIGYAARANGLTLNYWDSYIDRQTFEPHDPDLFAQIQSSWTERSGTASLDMVFVPKSGAIGDQTLTLNPNGTTFQGLSHNGTPLIQGTDYTVSGDQLTVTAAALTRLVGNRDYGVNATIQANFSQGLPWKIFVRTNDTPVVSNATGTTDSFAIPTQFNGDVLATMEAKYADGSYAGPANWTSYKEYWSSFRPDYTDNTTLLTSTFFNEVNDGARVTLTLHFWSGATVTYHVTRSGTSVTGTTA
ncbi:cellulase family glycosylhydrolase [Streptomyces sp. 4N509B]|uniref:cellulase family glycosylhydrolase n=1 Tax=Streptomyces sp. 4N509B TaxID=3457413 RepID=UPI003FCF0D6D